MSQTLLQSLPLIEPGKRALVAGRTGCGKSTLARWLLKRSPGHWVIINPKHTAAYDKLPGANKIDGTNLAKLGQSIKKHKFTIVNTVSSNNKYLDDLVAYLHAEYSNLGLCVDELYTMHNHGIAGEGLLGWLTRGRELNQSFLGLTQRPAWLSQFLFSESDYICEMQLGLYKDRKRIYDMTEKEIMLDKQPEHYWVWYDVNNDEIRRFAPVPKNS